MAEEFLKSMNFVTLLFYWQLRKKNVFSQEKAFKKGNKKNIPAKKNVWLQAY